MMGRKTLNGGLGAIISSEVEFMVRRRFLVAVVAVRSWTVVHQVLVAFFRDKLPASNASASFPCA